MKNIKYVAYFLAALLAMFILYGIYFAVTAYFFVIKLIVIALIITGIIAFYNKKVKKDID
jgi:hypothetical protein